MMQGELVLAAPWMLPSTAHLYLFALP